MAEVNKNFRVKHGLDVGGNGTFDGTVTADAYQVDTSLELIPAVGQLSWNPNQETLDLGLDTNVTLQIGQEHLIRVKNNSGSTAIPDFTFVMFSGVAGDTIKVSPAVTDGTQPPEYMAGITTEEISADGFGFITQFGFINNIDTSAYTVGQLLYANPTTPGGFVATRPAAPAFDKAVAAVTRSHATTGRILVRMDNGEVLDSLHNVEITSPTNGQVLKYNGSIWVNGDEAAGGGGGDSFTTIAVSGQDNIVADSSTDTLTLVAGSNVTITTNAASDSVTIAASGGITTGKAIAMAMVFG